MRPASIIASIERPPRSKKSLSTPHLATPSTWANSSHRISWRGVADRSRRRRRDFVDNHDRRWHAAVSQRLPGVGMQLRHVQTGAGRDDVGDQALVGLAGTMLDDSNVGEPGKGRQG
jgi:hypothetical protein